MKACLKQPQFKIRHQSKAKKDTEESTTREEEQTMQSALKINPVKQACPRKGTV